MKLTKSQLKQMIKEELRESLEDRLGGPEGGDPTWRVDIPKDPEDLRDFLDGIAKSIELMSDEEFRIANGERAFLRIGQVLADADPSMIADDPRYSEYDDYEDDAYAMASAGFGTDEDYGYYGDD